MNEVSNKLQNFDLVLNDIELFPQTYKTILKDDCINGTYQTILRRKINKMLKFGWVSKMTIPGTRFGTVIFFSENKKYNILVEGTRLGSKVYCFFKYEKLNEWYIKLSKYWILKSNMWEEFNDEITIFDGNILKWI